MKKITEAEIQQIIEQEGIEPKHEQELPRHEMIQAAYDYTRFLGFK